MAYLRESAEGTKRILCVGVVVVVAVAVGVGAAVGAAVAVGRASIR